MENLSFEYLLLAFMGMLIHVLMKVYERNDKSKPFSLKVFFKDSMNWIRIGLVVCSVIALMLMAEDLTDILGIKLTDNSPAKSVFSFLAGFMNHSLIRNILKRFKINDENN